MSEARTRAFRGLDPSSDNDSAPLGTSGAVGWVYSEYRVAVLLDVRRRVIDAPWVIAALQAVLGALARGSEAILTASDAASRRRLRPLLHLSLVACTRGGDPMRVLIYGWRHVCGEPADALIARAIAEVAALPRLAALRPTRRCDVGAAGRVSTGGPSSCEGADGAAPPTPPLDRQSLSGSRGGQSLSGSRGELPRRSRGAAAPAVHALASCVQQGLFVLSALPAAASPALAIISDGVAAPSHAPLLALRWRDTPLLLLLPPPGGSGHSDSGSSLSSPSLSSRPPRCSEAFGLVVDVDALHAAADFCGGIALQLPRSVAEAATAAATAASDLASASASASASAAVASAAVHPSSASERASDAVIARALLWRAPSDREACLAHGRAPPLRLAAWPHPGRVRELSESCPRHAP